MTEKRITVDDKKIVNCRADLNQLVPFKYTWAWDKYLTACANNWMPTEISMAADIKQWQTGKLTEEEQRIVKRNLGFFATADSLVANNLVLAVYKHLTNPECRQYLLRQAFEEAMHTHSYQHIIQSLGLDEGEVFNMYHELPSVGTKAVWAFEYTESICDPNLETKSVEGLQRFVRDLVAFYVIFEGIFFYAGFAMILSMGRRGKMSNTAEQFQYIMRDEALHFSFGLDVINTIRAENPKIWTKEFKAQLKNMISEAVQLEINYAQDCMPDAIAGMNSELYGDYLRYIGNRRCKQLGLTNLYSKDESQNPFDWMSTVIDLTKEVNFFEQKVKDYQSGGALQW